MNFFNTFKRNQNFVRNYIKKKPKKAEKISDEVLLCVLSFMRPVYRPVLEKSQDTIRKEEELKKSVETFQKELKASFDHKIQLKSKYILAAMETIPESLAFEAKKVDFTPTPMALFGIPRITPEIPGYSFEDDSEKVDV
jgi:hypothetical protein